MAPGLPGALLASATVLSSSTRSGPTWSSLSGIRHSDSPACAAAVRSASASPSVVANRPAVLVPRETFIAPVSVATSTSAVAPSSRRA